MGPFERDRAVVGAYHNHSDMSDGSASLEEMCRAGKAAGLWEFGMSDHWVIHPEPGSDADNWRMPPNRLCEYVDRLQTLKKELDSEDFTLRIGLEVDFFFENADEVLSELKKYPLDYLIGAVHYSGLFSVDGSADAWTSLDEPAKAAVCETYWQKMEGAARRREFLFLAHLDLPKKFALIRNGEYFSHAEKVLDVLRQTGGAIELNTSGWFKPCAEQYPARRTLQSAKDRGVPVVINADSHSPAHVTRGFAGAQTLLEECGYRFCGR